MWSRTIQISARLAASTYLVDYLATVWGVRRFNGSKAAAIGAVLGTLLIFVMGPPGHNRRAIARCNGRGADCRKRAQADVYLWLRHLSWFYRCHVHKDDHLRDHAELVCDKGG